jgi:hypothetical protein
MGQEFSHACSTMASKYRGTGLVVVRGREEDVRSLVFDA